MQIQDPIVRYFSAVKQIIYNAEDKEGAGGGFGF